ncbi:MAG: filamentous hemagglutinin N-terminal domain-containing protein [Selenomonadaceae bacterium]|nr:filamentous hemagglutinin N-terminal domain-containing protein [Selenomonadaceae bacterium]
MQLKQTLRMKIAISLAAGMFSIVPVALAMPSGLKSDTATQATADKVMTITGTATNNLLKWNSFSIASGETVAFANKNNYLNFVTGKEASQIFGTLSGGGTVYLINPNGILFGSTAQVNVGNLVASTRSLTDDQLAAYTASGTNPITTTVADAATGDITNLGTIKASSVVFEGNNIILKSTSDITNSDGKMLSEGRDVKAADQLTGNVMVKAAGTIKIGYEDAKKTGNYKDYSGNNSARTLGYILSDLSGYTAKASNTDHSASNKELKAHAQELKDSGKYSEYMLIHNAAELQNLSTNAQKVAGTDADGNATTSNTFNGNFFLANDIDAGGVDFVPLAGNKADFGNAVAYAGDFNGLGYTISNLTINDQDGSYRDNLGGVGLFAQIGASGKVENLTVKDATVSVKAKTKGNAGIIAGVSKGTIRGITVSGSVTGSTEAATGGVVGDMQDGNIANVINQATVENGKRVGGVIGILEKGTLDNAINTGTVQGQCDASKGGAGGVVGENKGTVSNISNKGTVAVTDSKGNVLTAATVNSLVGKNSGTVTDGTATAGGNTAYTYTTTESTDTPTTPGSSDTPTTPGSSDTPTTPGSSDTPTTPGSSDTPTTPGSSDTPTTPGSSDTPMTPGSSDTPTTPGSSDTPTQPTAEPTHRAFAGKPFAKLTESEKQTVTNEADSDAQSSARRTPAPRRTPVLAPGSFVVSVQGTGTNVDEQDKK